MKLVVVAVLASLAAASDAFARRRRASHHLRRQRSLGFLQDIPEIVHKRSRHTVAIPLSESLRLVQKNASAPLAGHAAATPLDVRPSAKGEPTIVKFAMFMKQFYGVDFKRGTVTADMVLSLRWEDNRTAALVPEGQNQLTLSQERASGLLWMPHVGITNRDIGGVRVISTAVTVSKSGVVEKVQRILTVVKNTFDVRAFPFDIQNLRFRIASTTLMADQLKMKVMADKGSSGVKDGIFAGQEFSYVSSSTRVFEEKDGDLVKSRGEFVIEVHRNIEPYMKTVLVPSLILVAVAYTVFLFPPTSPFIMPRVATSVISFMSLMVLSVRTSALLPSTGSGSWIDTFFNCCMMMMFSSMCLNIFVEFLEHELSHPEIANRVQKELRVGLPTVEILILCICFLWSDYTRLTWLDVCTYALWWGVVVPYLGLCVKRVVGARRTKAEAEGEPEAAEDGRAGKALAQAEPPSLQTSPRDTPRRQ